MKRLVACVLLLGGCANADGVTSGGTAVRYAGPLCGAESATLALADQKDRSAFDGGCSRTTTYYRADGSIERVVQEGVQITSAESSYSAVLAKQAEIIGSLGDVVGGLAAGAATGGLGGPQFYVPAPPPAFEREQYMPQEYRAATWQPIVARKVVW